MSWPQLIFLILTPLWTGITHATVSRLGRVKRQEVAIWACLLTTFTVVTLLILTSPKTELTWAFFLFSFLNAILLVHVYFHFFNMSETARRIKLLEKVGSGKFQSEPGVYTPEALVHIRLERLGSLGRIRLESGRYFLQDPWLSVTARFLTAYERLLFPLRRKQILPRSGLDLAGDSSVHSRE